MLPGWSLWFIIRLVHIPIWCYMIETYIFTTARPRLLKCFKMYHCCYLMCRWWLQLMTMVLWVEGVWNAFLSPGSILLLLHCPPLKSMTG